MKAVAITVIVGMLTTGCVGPTIYGATPRPQFEKPILKRIVLADATYDKNVIPDVNKPFFAAIERGLRDEMSKTNLTSDLVYEREMPTKGYGVKNGRVYLVRYRATDFKEAVETNILPLVLIVLVVTSPLVGLVHPTDDTIWMTFEMKIYDVTDAPTVKIKDTTSEEYLNVYNTSELSPIYRESYNLNVHGSAGYAKGVEITNWSRDMAADLARQLIQKSARAVQETVAR
jgi:hypothetical protein